MNQIKCKCGESSKNFAHLTQNDLPEGWQGDCCEAKEKQEKAPKEEPVSAPVEEVAKAEEAPKPASRRSRKGA